MKVLIISHSSELGGAERSMIDVFDYWTKHYDVEPHFIIRKPLNSMVPELKKRGWSYHALYYTNWSQRTPSKRAEDVFRNARYNAQAVKDIEKIIEKIQPDLVMTNTIVAPWAAIAAYFRRIPHVWFVREYGDIDHQHVFELGRERMMQDIETLSDMVITNSETLANYVKQYIKTLEVRPLYMPFDIEYLEQKSLQENNNPYKFEDSLKLVITGRIAPSKGQEEAAKAVGELNKRGYNTELCVIGTPADPKDAEALNQVIENYGISDKVHLMGHQSNPLAIIKYADIGVMASRQEAFGRVTFEYMVMGLPVVGANTGATPELIKDGVNGQLYKKGNTKSLIAQVLKYAEDSTLVRRHGAAAKKRARQMMSGQYNIDHFAAAIDKLLASKHRDKQPLNFARRWLDYPLVAQQYIEDSKVISLKRLLKIRIRARLKALYLKVTSLAGR